MALKRIEFPTILVMALAKSYVKDQTDNQPTSAVKDRVPGTANDPRRMGTVRDEGEVFSYQGRAYPHLQPVVEDGHERYADDNGKEQVRPRWKAVPWPKECHEAATLAEQEAADRLREEQRVIRESKTVADPAVLQGAGAAGPRR